LTKQIEERTPPLLRNGSVTKLISVNHPFEKASQYARLRGTDMKFADSKRMAFALFLLPGVFAQTSTQGPLAVVAANGTTLVSDLVNAATGALSQAQVIVGSNGNFQLVAAEPGGRFVYAVGDQMLNGYTIDAGNGALTPIPGSPYTLPVFGSAIAVEASGRFLYVGLIPTSTQVVGPVAAYSIDPATGALMAIVGSPFAVSSGANALVSNAAGMFSIPQETGSRSWRLIRPRGR
jgi:hypothetical protein